jgi:nucleoside phosphorylase
VADGASVMADEPVARQLAARLGAAGERVSLGAVAGVDAPVLTRAAKAKLRNATMAAAVDMESGIAARFAARPSPSCASSAIPPSAICRLL